MCLAVIALHQLPGIPLLIASNRDEFHARPTAPASAWPGEPALYAGRDLQAGGTWMGVTDNGRYALLTNYREGGRQIADAPSRGHLTEAFLRGNACPADYLADLAAEGARYNGFNLIVGDLEQSWYYSNRGGVPRALGPGLYGVSNHLLDTPWPKLTRLKARVAQALTLPAQPDLAALFDALRDPQTATDDLLPQTGVSLEMERLLSSPFIVSPNYGTRCSSVLFWRDNGSGELHERRFAPDASESGATRLAFCPQRSPCLN